MQRGQRVFKGVDQRICIGFGVRRAGEQHVVEGGQQDAAIDQRQLQRGLQRCQVGRYAVGGEAGEQPGDEGIARAGGIDADHRLRRKVDRLLLKSRQHAGFTLGDQQQLRPVALA